MGVKNEIRYIIGSIRYHTIMPVDLIMRIQLDDIVRQSLII